MNLRMKYKTLKRENEGLNKQLKMLDATTSDALRYQNSLECRVAAQNILILEIEKENRNSKNAVELLEKNNDALHRALNYKIKDSMDQRFMIEELTSENRSLSKALEIKNKGFFKRIFA